MSESEKKKRQSTWYEKQGLITIVLLLNLGLGWHEIGSSILGFICFILLIGTVFEASIRGISGQHSNKKISFDKKIWGFLASLIAAFLIYGIYNAINTAIWH